MISGCLHLLTGKGSGGIIIVIVIVRARIIKLWILLGILGTTITMKSNDVIIITTIHSIGQKRYLERLRLLDGFFGSFRGGSDGGS